MKGENRNEAFVCAICVNLLRFNVFTEITSSRQHFQMMLTTEQWQPQLCSALVPLLQFFRVLFLCHTLIEAQRWPSGKQPNNSLSCRQNQQRSWEEFMEEIPSLEPSESWFAPPLQVWAARSWAPSPHQDVNVCAPLINELWPAALQKTPPCEIWWKITSTSKRSS